MASIKIKGINNNLVFIFEEGRGEEYLEILKDKFSANPQLFDGSPVVFKGKGLNTLSFEDISQLQKLCLEYGMILNNIELNINRTFNKDLFIHRNVRSGQKIHSEGSVIVWGDVHESSEIIAGGDIIVLGKMEGIAHAGFYGNTRSIVFALNLCPGQIRIANTISSPAAEQDKKAKETVPEFAYLNDGSIHIKAYNARKTWTASKTLTGNRLDTGGLKSSRLTFDKFR